MWLYDVSNILKQPPPLLAAPQAPMQVLPVSSCPDLGWQGIRDPAFGQQEPSPALLSPPHQILKWPQPWALGQAVTKTMVNTVVANASFTYLTALTDSNIVAIWGRL